jgi:thymidylate synthase (FAD)
MVRMGIPVVRSIRCIGCQLFVDRFRVEVISQTPNPQQTIYAALHQDYSEDFVFDDLHKLPSETECGEIAVKRLLAGNRGHYGCYTPDTEVLTRRGWVQFPNLLPQEEVVAIDIQTDQAHFESPIAYQKYTINDKIYQVKGQNLSLAVTLDHRMVVAHRKKNGDWTDYYFASAADVVGKPRKYINSSFLKFALRCSYPSDLPPGYEPEQLMKLAGFFIGDGCINNASIHTRFRIVKRNKIDYLYALGFEIEEHSEDRYSLADQKVAAWLQQNFTHNREKYIPWSYLNLTPDLVASLLEGMRITDGTEKRSSWSYDSTSKQVLDFLQAILHLNGLSGSYSFNNPNSGEEHTNHKPCGRIHISKRREPRVEICQNNRSRSYVESIESYEGDVFCVTVSTGALLVRKDRKVIVCGNCLEHPQIVFNCGYFPHSVMQQARTHRTGVSFDVQCLAGDTEITFVNSYGESSQKSKKTIGELYDLWVNGEKAVRQRLIKGRKGEPPGEYRRDCKQRIRKMRLRVLNEETGLFEVAHIKDVMCSGIQPVYRLILEDGKHLDCTENHRLFTSEGWQTMSDAVGLVTNSNGRSAMIKPCFIMCNGISGVGNKLYQNKEWLQSQITGGLSTAEIAQLSGCLVFADRSLAYEFNNLVTLCKDCHQQIHQNNQEAEFARAYSPIVQPENWQDKPRQKDKRLRSHPVKVKSVEYIGEQMTYDLEVEGTWHNFVANGMVVHNSLRYTGLRFLDVVTGKRDIEEVFYLRPVGDYEDRQGKKYHYSAEQRKADLQWCFEAVKRYSLDIEAGMSEEHARGKLPFDYRQHFIVSFNLRSLMHFLDLRGKKNAQLEIQKLCDLMWVHFENWTPEIADWYAKNRLGKAKLSP